MSDNTYPIDHVFGPDADGDYWRRHPDDDEKWQFSYDEPRQWFDVKDPDGILISLVPLLAPLAKPTPTVTDANDNVWNWRDKNATYLVPRFVSTAHGHHVSEGTAPYPVFLALYRAQHDGRNPWEDA